MNIEKLNAHDLIAGIARQAGETKKDTELFLRELVLLIQEALLKEELVKIKGLGTFKLQWNESRKSVNVNTGEDIEIPGHYKVVFMAENELKDFINEPYAHLETVILDGNEDDHTPKETVADPLRNFSEQAKEIASLISDLKITNKKEDIPLAVEMETENTVTVENKFEKNTENAVQDLSPGKIEEEMQQAELVENDAILPEEDRMEEENNAQEQSPKKKKNYWFWKLLLIILLLLVAGYFLFPRSIYRDFIDQMILKKSQVEQVEEKAIEVEPVPVEKQEQSPSVQVPEEIAAEVSQPVAFRFNPSDYGTDRIVVGEGARLAWYSTKYYGSYMFWPYIYIANMDILSKPDSLEVGMTIKIPKLPPEMIDVNNPEAVERVSYIQVRLDEYK